MKIKRFLCVALVILMLPLWVIGCDDNTQTPGDDTNVSEADKLIDAEGRIKLVDGGAPLYTIIRSDNASSAVSKLSGLIVDAVIEKCGVELPMNSDWLERGTEPDPNAKEILIGTTNRAESTTVSDSLSDINFGIEVVGNKIVITAKEDVNVERAVAYFIENYIDTVPAVDGKFSVEGNINYRSSSEYITLATTGNDNYMVTWPYSEKEYCIWTYTAGNSLESLAAELYTLLGNEKKHSLALSSDRLLLETMDPNAWKEVLVGSTTRNETLQVKATLDYNEYAIKVVNNKVVVTGMGHSSTREAVELFKSFLEKYRDSATGAYRLPADFAYTSTYSGAKSWELAIPEYVGGRLDSVSDGGDSSYVAVVKETTKDEYDTYLASLEAAGYSKHSENTIGENFFAIYKNVKTVLNVYYTTYDASTHIVVEKASTTNLPATAAENTYTDKGIKPTITQMFINHFEKNGAANNGGQCYVFELADGRFIVVDGGPNGKENNKDDAENLYNLLLDRSGGEKPVIAAWFVTHLHGDHVITFQDFADKYASKVTVEDVIYNYPIADMCNGLTTEAINTFNKAINKFTGANKIKTHTGQKFYYANAEIDMILAQDLIYPQYVQFYNDSSLTFMVKMAGQNILITGDLSPNAAPILTEMYGTALQCDILQIAHHGSMGPDVEFYKMANPTQLALLPMGQGQSQRLTTEAENVYIAKLVKIIPHYKGTQTFDLPYYKK